MNSSEIILLVGLVIGFDILVIIVILRVRAKRRGAGSALRRVATEEGWSMLTEGDRTHYSGKTDSGVTWHLESSRSGSVWWSEEAVLEGDQVIALGPFGGLYEKFGGDIDLDLAHPMIQAALTKLFGAERAEHLARARMVDLGDRVPEGFSLFTDTEELSLRLLADPIAPLLAEWRAGSAAPPAIILDSDRLELRFKKELRTPDEWRQVIALGSVLALRVGEMGGGVF